MKLRTQVVNSGSHSAHTVILSGKRATLDAGHAERVALALHANRVAVYERQGDDLILVLTNGEWIRLNNFFRDDADGRPVLFLEKDDCAEADAEGVDGRYIEINFRDDRQGILQPILPEDSCARIDDQSAPEHAGGLPDMALLPLALLGAGGAAAGVAAAGGGGSGGGAYPFAWFPPAAPVAPTAPTLTLSDANANGRPEVAGTAAPGSTVTVTWPDGSTSVATADASGHYTAESPTVQPNGAVSAVGTSPTGATSPSATATYTDTTPPAAPTLAAIDANLNGRPEASGTAEPGSTVTLTWPDGTTSSVMADASGQYTVEAPTVQPTGPVTATATDINGNVGPAASTIFIDPPTLAVSDADADGLPEAAGVAGPGSTVTVIWPDGSISTTVVDAAGQYAVEAPTVQPSGLVTATATDLAGEVSPATTATYTDATPPALTLAVAEANSYDQPEASGAAEPGATVTVTWPDGSTSTTVADMAGHYLIEAPTAQTSGLVTATATDINGNTAPAATVDYIDSIATRIASFNDNVGANQSDYASGTATDDASPVLHGAISAPLPLGEEVRVYEGATLIGTASVSGTSWTLALSGLSEGTHSYTAVVADATGIDGPISSPFVVTVDTTAPTAASVIASFTDNVGTHQGDYPSATSTDDASPVLNGTLSAPLASGEEVRVYEGATLMGTASVSGTSWTLALSGLSEGTHSYTAVVADAAGNEGTASSPFAVAVDTTAPVRTATIATFTDNVGAHQGNYPSATSTDDASPVLNGTLSAPLASGEELRVYEGATLIGTANVSGTSWTLALSGLSEGTHSYTAVVADAAGNEGTASVAFAVAVDTTAPATTTVIASFTDNVGTQQGNYVGGTATDDSSPVLNGTLSAPLAAGEEVRVYEGATLIGTANVSGTSWTLALSGLAEGTHNYTAVVADAAGNEGTASAAFAVAVDTTAPATTTIIASFTDNVGLHQGDYPSATSTDDASPVLNGTLSAPLAAGEELRIYEGATLIGTASVSGTSWTLALSGLAEGTHSYTAVVADAAGNEGTASSPFAVAVDTTAPATTTVIASFTDNIGTQQGNYASGTATDDASPVLNGTLSAPLAAGEELRVYEGATLIGTASVSGTSWTLALSGLSEGTHNYTAVVADAAGNEGTASSPFAVAVDTTAPTVATNIASFTDNIGTQQGNYASGTPTDDSSPVLNGTLSAPLVAGEELRVYEGATLVGTASVSGTSWTLGLSGLSEGTHSYTAVVADAAGNEGTASSPFAVAVDTTAPTVATNIASFTDNVGTQQGNYLSGTATDDSSPVLNGTLSAPLASGEEVRVYEGATLIGTASASGTSWTLGLSGLSEGTHSYTAVVADAAGNEGTASSPFAVAVDTTAPTVAANIASFTDNVGTQQGNYLTGTATDDSSPVLNGTLSAPLAAGEELRVYEGATLIGTASVSGTSWTLGLSGLSEGTHSYTAVVADAAGNEGTASSPFAVAVDTTAPAAIASIASFTDNIGTQQGNYLSATSTDDSSPVLNGTLSAPLAAGEEVRVYEGATFIGTASVSGTSWTLALSGLSEGTHSYTAVVADAAGNEGTASSLFAVAVDTTAPVTTAAIATFTDNVGLHQGDYPSATSTDDASPVLNGTLSAPLAPGEEVRVYEGATLIGTASVSGTSWTLALSGLSEGTHSYTAVVADAAGNEGTASSPFAVAVDTTAPVTTATIATFTDNVGLHQGDYPGATSTDDSSPVLNGTLSAPLAAGEEVRVYEGATLIGTASVSGTSWTLALSGLAEGTHSYTAVVADAAGNEGTASSPFAVAVDTTAPATTTVIASFTDNIGTQQGNYASGTATDDASPVLNGTLSAPLAAGEELRVYEGATLIGTASVSGTSWTLALSGLSEGTHNYTAVVADAAGNEGTASSPFAVAVDTTAPTVATNIASFTDNIGTQQGNYASGTPTDDSSPVLNGTLSAPLVAGEELRVYEGATLVGTASVSGTSWTLGLSGLSEGTHSYTAVVADAAGNEGTASSPFAVAVDTTAPTVATNIASFTDNVGTQQGNYLSGTATDDSSPVLNGTLSAPLAAGEEVRIYEGATLVGTAGVSGTGWTLALSGLSEGTHSYTAVVADAAGNEGTASSPFAVAVDTTAPATTTVIASFTDNIGTQQGNYASGTATDDSSPVLNGTLSAPLAAGEELRVYEGATLVGTASVSGTSWTLALSGLSEGTHSYTAVVADAAGNEGTASSPFAVAVDTTAPTVGANIASFTDNVGTQQGNYASATSTDDSSPVLNGTLSAPLAAGEEVRVYEGATLIGTASVSGTSWTLALSGLSEGTHSYTAVVADAAGNEGTASSPFAVAVDTTAPTVAANIASFTDNVGTQQGNYLTGTATDDSSPVLNGTLSAPLAAGEELRVYEGATLIGTASVSGTSWTLGLSGLSEGTHSYTAVVADAAGNEGTASSPFAVAVDTTAPAAIASIASFTDNIGTQQGNYLSATSTDDSSPVLNGTLSAPLAAGEEVRVYEGATFIGTASVSGTSWTLALSGLSEGTHSYTAVVADAAGNEGTASSLFAVAVDTTAPVTTAAIATFTDNVGLHQGDYPSATSTDDASPVLNGTLSAPLAPGEEVRVYEGATLIGTASVSGTSWTLALSGLSEGTHSYTAVVADAAGNEGTASSPFAVAVDTTAPVTTATIATFTDNVGLHQGDYPGATSTDDSSPVLNGTLSAPLAAGEEVRVYEGATLIGTASVSGTGWTLALSGLSEGTHSYTAVVADAAGNEGTASSPFAVAVDTTAPVTTVTIATFTDNVGLHQGDYPSATSTDDASPVLNGTLSAALAAGEEVRVYEGATLVGTASVSGPSWTLGLSALSEGTHSYTAVVADAAGNEGTASSPFAVAVDTTAPTVATNIASFTDNVGTQQGNYLSGAATDDSSPVLNGTLSAPLAAGEELRVYEGATLIGTASVSGTSWTLGLSGLSEGTHSYTAVVADAAGNEGTASAAFAVAVDTTAPTVAANIASFTDNVGTQQGNYPSATSTDDASPVLNGTLSAPLASGEEVRVYEGATLIGTASVSGTSWTLALSGLSEGTHSYTAVVADAAGIDGPVSSPFVLTVDTTAPTAATVIASYTDNVGTQQGNYLSGTATDDASPVLNGTLSAPLAAGEELRVYEGATLVGTASVSGTSWTLALSGLAEGTHSYTAVVADAAGNEGTASSPFAVAVDMTAPVTTAAIATFTDNVGTHQGDYPSATSTDDASPVLNGTLSAPLASGEELRVYEGATLIGTASVSGTSWTLALSALAEGTHNYTAVVADAAGNEGTASSPFAVAVDTTAPSGTLLIDLASASDTGPSTTDNITALSTPTVTVYVSGVNAADGASIEAGSTTLNLWDDANNNNVIDAGERVLVSNDNFSAEFAGSSAVISFTLPSLPDAVYNLKVEMTDPAGNAKAGYFDSSSTSGSLLTISTGTFTTANAGYSVQSHDGLGFAASPAGDFNGDGYMDYAVSGPHAHFGDTVGGASELYLIYGSANGLPSTSDADSLSASKALHITGQGVSGDQDIQGLQVQGVGDLNGDGFSDLLVTSVLNDGAFVIWGRAAATGTISLGSMDTTATSDGFAIHGVAGSVLFGAAAGGTDLNNDGYADLLLSDPSGYSAESSPVGTLTAGALHVLYGHSGAGAAVWTNLYGNGNGLYDSVTNTQLGAGAQTTIGTNDTGAAHFGGKVQNVGDVNGDGILDFVVTDPRLGDISTPNSGAAYLVFGQQSGLASDVNITSLLSAGQAIRLDGSQAGEDLGGVQLDYGNNGSADAWRSGEGNTIAALGDINGDGFGDFAIGSPEWGDGLEDGFAPGRVYVLYGGQSGWASGSIATAASGATGFTLTSSLSTNATNGWLGYDVRGAGDVNGDGVDDFLIGAPGIDAGGTDSGSVYLVYGVAGGGFVSGNLESMVSGGTAVRLDDLGAGSLLGVSTAMGDWNGDGISDFAIGAWGINTGAGGFYSFLGSTSALTQSFTVGNDTLVAGGTTIGAASIVDGVDRISGGLGNDTILGIGTDTTGTTATSVLHDVAYGGQGSDAIHLAGLNFTRVDGGEGIDTLALDGSGLVLNLGVYGDRVQGFEKFDLGSGGNELDIRLSDVLNEPEAASTLGHIEIAGSATSTVNLIDGGGAWSVTNTQTVGSVTFDVYHNSALDAAHTFGDVWIQQGIVVV
ncbi:Ig-like domain-containing protein [Methylocystis iwaonis]|uniref:Ig-like domain-containing protein n=1 Tax=Methylocystis iwaonis TaxID=2885079 RepID=UPI002E7C309F|nr:Ig-like domain-containing protein [Methylocystis iwaonis]